MSALGHAPFIIATHSSVLLACPESIIYSFDNIPAKVVHYEETELYKVYKKFMENPRQYFKEE